MDQLIAKLAGTLGPSAVVAGQAIKERYQSPWQRLGSPGAVALPRSTGEVVSILRLAGEAGVAVVPWGGRTGLVDGCCADAALALSLEHMAAIERIDPIA